MVKNRNSVNFNSAESAQNQIKKDNPGFFKKFGAGIVGGAAAAAVTAGVVNPTTKIIMDKFVKLNHSMKDDEVQILNKASEKILEKSGLKAKGVKLLRKYAPEDIAIVKEMEKNAKGAFTKQDILYQAVKGENSFFLPLDNRILSNKKMSLAQFHEIGHAMNWNNKGFGKFLFNLRKEKFNLYADQKMLGKTAKFPIGAALVAVFSSLVGLTAIFKNKKAEGEKPQGFFDTVTSFIKDNVGKLTFLTMLPVVIEEGLASYKGEKAVKGLVNENLFKKIKTSNRLGLATYATVAAVTGFGAYLASKIRDKIAQPNLNKN